MNIIRIIDRYDRILCEFDTEFEYEIGETIIVNSTVECKCKDVIQGLKNNVYVFVQGWIEFGF